MSSAFPVLLDSTKNRQGAWPVSPVLRAELPFMLELSARLTVSPHGSCHEREALQCHVNTARQLSLDTPEIWRQTVLHLGGLSLAWEDVYLAASLVLTYQMLEAPPSCTPNCDNQPVSKQCQESLKCGAKSPTLEHHCVHGIIKGAPPLNASVTLRPRPDVSLALSQSILPVILSDKHCEFNFYV